jgi:hypothetical protein
MPATPPPTTKPTKPTQATQPAKPAKTTKDGQAPRRALAKTRAAARPYKKVAHVVLLDRISTMQKQLHVMGCKTALLQHRLGNYEKEQQQRDGAETPAGPSPRASVV